jgi:hypothetical protein
MFGGFSVLSKKRSVEYIVNLLCFREIKSVCDAEDLGSYPEGSVLPW